MQHGSFEAYMSLSSKEINYLQWWSKNIPTSYNEITKCSAIITMKSDAYKTDWGATCISSKSGGTFSLKEPHLHINSLELLAAENLVSAENSVQKHL